MNWVGVDQTGAVDRYGRYKPLHAALLTTEAGHFRLLPFKLRELSFRDFSRNFSNAQAPGNYIWVIDCVVGLPAGFPPLRQLIKLASMTPNNGRKAAQDFFESLLTESGLKGVPARKVEHLVGSNSVFRSKPFQRNIQTGTFRMWKELGLDPDWFSLAGHEQRQRNRSWIMEGYPSLAWRQLFSAKKRSAKDFPVLLKQKFPLIFVSKEDLKLFERSVDACDAAVLAIQAATQKRSVTVFSTPLAPEGWILGAPVQELR